MANKIKVRITAGAPKFIKPGKDESPIHCFRGKVVVIDEDRFEADYMEVISGSAPAKVEATAEAEVAVESPVDVVDEVEEVVEEAEEEAAEEVVEAEDEVAEEVAEVEDEVEEVEDEAAEVTAEEIKAMGRVDLHAYAESQGVDPTGKKMGEIRAELGVE